MTIHIEYEATKKLDLPYKEIIEKVVKEALIYMECPYETEVNIMITGNEQIHRINLETRNMDCPTDVLSFPMVQYCISGNFGELDEDSFDYFNPETGELLFGDIVISADKVIEQAADYGHSEERELGFLTAHSMLHLAGYDHMEEEERIDMEQRQEEILWRCGITRESV